MPSFFNDTTERVSLALHVAGKHHKPSVLDVFGGGVGAAAGGKRWFVFTLKEDMKQSVLNLITTLFYCICIYLHINWTAD